MPDPALRFLIQRKDVAWVNLLKRDHESWSSCAAEPGDAAQVVDVSNELNDFADTAALIANLDLVIAVDTAVAHLACAMGKPCWIMLPYVAEWRWMIDREDSPWYPSAR